MARNIQQASLRDFTGGLNIRADQFQLGVNESPDILNMDVDPRGGVRLRRGVAPWGPTLDHDIHSVMAYYGAVGGDHVLVGGGGHLWGVVAGEWTSAAILGSGPYTSAQFKDALYVQSGEVAPIKWNGTATTMGSAWSNDFGAPTTGNMPIGECIAAHNGHIFVANTLEDETRHPSRVRFSHPNMPESFRSQDWFDVDPGVDGDEIVALVPFQDHLLVFKRKSVYLVYGFDAESFQIQSLSREVGAVGPQAVVATPTAVYFFALDSGLMRYDGRRVEWAFAKLVPALDSGDIPQNEIESVTCGWIENRVWVSVPWRDDTRRTYVMDPSLSKEGSWVHYDLELGAYLHYATDEGARVPLAAYGDRLLEVEKFGQYWDELTEDPEDRSVIQSRYVTPWLDAGSAAVRKRWRRPWFVFVGTTDERVEISVFRDYDPYVRAKTFYENISRQRDEHDWMAGSVEWVEDPDWERPELYPEIPSIAENWPEIGYDWSIPHPLIPTWTGIDPPEGTEGYVEWDGVDEEGEPLVWGGEGAMHQIERGSTLGLAHAIQLAFRGPENIAHWGLDNITFVYIPRKLR